MEKLSLNLKSYIKLIEFNPELFENINAPYKIITDVGVITSWQEKRRLELSDNQQPLDWAEIGIVFDDYFIIIVRDLVEFPDGNQYSYVRLIHKAELSGGQGVVILPVIDGKVVLENHFRHATRLWHYEIPRGLGEPNTPAEVQAENEIRDEIGGEIESIHNLGSLFNNTGMETNQAQLFLAKLATIGNPQIWEAIDERLEIVSVKKLEDMIRDEHINDGFTIAAYARAKLKGLL